MTLSTIAAKISAPASAEFAFRNSVRGGCESLECGFLVDNNSSYRKSVSTRLSTRSIIVKFKPPPALRVNLAHRLSFPRR